MPVAAVPRYLGGCFQGASPGMRFGMYLPIWARREDQERRVRAACTGSREGTRLRSILDNQGMDAAIEEMRRRHKSFPELWGKDDEGARAVWKDVVRLGQADQSRMKALAERQVRLAEVVPSGQVARLEATAVSPFTTGLGNEHPLENGFAFLWPYGLPYLPGSGVKGVVRQAARELAKGLWGEEFRGEWDDAPRYVVRDGKGKTLAQGLSMLDVLFGKETEGGEKEHFRGVLTFWDVIPQIEGGALHVEIMTPHQKHYYQGEQRRGRKEIEPPHDCGDPTPIPFLTVPPGSRFVFHVVCDAARLRRVAPDLAEEDRWRTLLEAAFGHAFEWLGFGAKTAVGYGAMRPGAPAAVGPRGAEARKPTMEEAEETWEGATVRYDPGAQRLTAARPGCPEAVVTGKDRVDALLQALSKSKRNKLKGGLTMTVRVRRLGNRAEIVGLDPGGG